MAKPISKYPVLLWFYNDKLSKKYSDSYARYGGNGCIVFKYENTEDWMKNLLNVIRDSDPATNADRFEGFLDSLAKGKVKIGKFVKCHNDTPNSIIPQGGIVMRGTIDGSWDTFSTIDGTSNNNNWHMRFWELQETRDLTEDEISSIRQRVKMENEDVLESVTFDSVFNTFVILSLINKTSQWTDNFKYSNVGLVDRFQNIPHEMKLMGYDTERIWNKEEAEKKMAEIRARAVAALELTKALTGYGLKIYNSDVDFIEAIMTSRIVETCDVDIYKIGEPTLTVEELFKKVVAENDPSDSLQQAAKLCLSKVNSIKGKEIDYDDTYYNSDDADKLEVYLPFKGITAVTSVDWKIATGLENRSYLDSEEKKQVMAVKQKLSKLPNSITFDDVVYLWGDDAATYNLTGDIRTFVKIIDN